MTDAFETYSVGLHRCLNIMGQTTYEARYMEIRQWYKTNGRDQFVAVFQHETGNRLNERRGDGQRVELGLYKSPSDSVAKVKDAKFYSAHAEWFIAELDQIFAAETADSRPKIEPYFVGLYDILQSCLRDSIVLLEDFARWHQAVPGVFGVVKNRRELNAFLYDAAVQSIYGSYSPLSSPKRSTDMAISNLRMNIEMRLRCGFGVFGINDLRTDTFRPLPLSNLIEAISKHSADIKLGRPVAHIDRIYRWANLYVHGGFKLYAWCAPATLRYLKPFLVGGRYTKASSRGSSLFAGIQTSTETLIMVQQSVLPDSNRNADLEPITSPPEQCDLVLTDA